jgi:hypothetical protein
MAKTRRTYKGGAASTTITGTLTSGGSNFVIAAYTGWPYGSNPFFVVIEPGTANEEKLLVTRSGATDTTVNVTTRGADDTTAAQHAAGSVVYPVFTAVDADEANELAATMTSKGDLLTHDTSTFARLAVGTNAHVLKADSSTTTGLAWGQVATAGIADDAVTSAKIASGAVATSELASDAVTTVKILDSNVTAGKLASDSVTTAKIVDGNVTAAKLASDSVTTAKISDGSVTISKLALTEVKLRRVAAQSYSYSGGSTQTEYISWDTEDADVGGFISATSDTLTVPAGLGGLYLFNYRFTCDLTSGSIATCRGNHLLVNADTVAIVEDLAGSTGAATNGQTSGIIYLAAGDTLKVGIRVDLDTSSSADVTAAFWMTRIMD